MNFYFDKNSALDSESEAIVQEALDKLIEAGNQTVIVIAHRLSTIRNADMIAVFSGGKVVETGTHSELIEQNGIYHGLIQTQRGHRRSSSITSTDGSESGPPSRHSSFSSNQTRYVDLATGEDSDTKVQKLLDDEKPILSFHRVRFKYPTRPEQKIFRGLDLDVREGETLALVGPSGQGKSTIIQLIEQFYRPTQGSVKYRGVELKELNVGWYRSQIGLVSQEPVLFDISIAENIRFGFPEATQEEIEAAAKEANAHDFISSFPDGYQTEVGSGSTQISGGQKQRIAIARALLRKPKVRGEDSCALQLLACSCKFLSHLTIKFIVASVPILDFASRRSHFGIGQ